MRIDFTPFVLLGIKLVLGISFVYASWHKIENPAEFARILYGYDLFPAKFINILAITIPFLELTSGFCLIMGLFPRSAVLIVSLLLSGFIVAIVINLIRGHAFDCGCFSIADKPSSTLNNGYVLARNVVMLAMGGYFLKKAISS